MHGRVAYLGVAFVLLGAALLAAPTFGFETIAAERTADVATAPDEQAILGIETVQTSVQGSDVELVRITNNADESLTLSPNAQISGTDRVQIADDGSGTLAPGESASVTASCSGNGQPQGQATLDTDMIASGSTLSIDLSPDALAITFDCRGNGGGPPGGPANFVANDPQYTGSEWAQQFEVNADDLDSNGELTIDLSDAQANSGVEYNGATATLLSGQNARSFGFDDQASTIAFEARGNPSGILRIELRGLQLTSDQDGTASFSDTSGRSGSDQFDVPAIGNDGGGTDTNGDAWVENGTNANGQIQAGGDVIVGDHANANGQIQADGDVTAGDGVSLNRQVQAGGTVVLGDGSSTNGQIEAGGDLIVGSGSTLNDQVDVEGSVTLGSGSVANGQIQAGGDVYLEDDTTVQQQVQAGGTVYIGCNVEINGQIDAPTESTC